MKKLMNYFKIREFWGINIKYALVAVVIYFLTRWYSSAIEPYVVTEDSISYAKIVSTWLTIMDTALVLGFIVLNIMLYPVILRKKEIEDEIFERQKQYLARIREEDQ